jgi:pilus assembly protein CpaB
MSRRILAATAAVLLALTGALVLVSYANGADDRARAGEDLVSVLVLDGDVAAGTPVTDVERSASFQEVPSRLVAEDAVTDRATLDDLEGQVTAAPLLPGEQLRTARFTLPSRVADPGTELAPDGTVEVSVALDAQRAVAGAVRPGDKVGVQIAGAERLGDVLVTRVGGPEEGGDSTAIYLVTLALTPDQAAAVVVGSATEPVWLSLEKRSSRDTGDSTTTVSLGGNQ